MKKVFVLLAVFMVIGCTQYGQKEAAKPLTDVEKAGQLWAMMQKEDYRNTWKMWPGKEAFYKGSHPHGALLTTYVNESAHDVLVNKKG